MSVAADTCPAQRRSRGGEPTATTCAWAFGLAAVILAAVALFIAHASFAPQAAAAAAKPCAGLAPTIAGTKGEDLLRGTAGLDIVQALGGRDRVRRLEPRDIVCAGGGRDRVKFPKLADPGDSPLDSPPVAVGVPANIGVGLLLGGPGADFITIRCDLN